MVSSITSVQEYEDITLGKNVDPSTLIVIEFGSVTCTNTQMMNSVVGKFQADFKKSFKLYKLNIKEFPEIAKSLNIKSTPTYKFYKNGKDILKFVGADPASIRKLIVANV
ncbi:hypothetical protein TPHA_0A00150 [Tetrapisispora phaffii CBS 4417]|uniref:Thioredoxin domain-containing protein n=1 Tax=Tetrapisispora phaffii (strain ATCC 24235 / CBS 4417 / NBRC 1672 / NRRL Y-8282 / UCD 70-5) TaxID=1071381 RepID=G8BMH2_TETPH|nr:hypothetical protein TPHA_0A00150 [Tetrapisispora phaffii CBS 4417]CCE61100.1 hypothetical protein TPHA_0A00150 [Tetrapisispora phaffii CBS 4417]